MKRKSWWVRTSKSLKYSPEHSAPGSHAKSWELNPKTHSQIVLEFGLAMVTTSDLNILERITEKGAASLGNASTDFATALVCLMLTLLSVAHLLFTKRHKALETTSPNLGSRIFAHACRRAGGKCCDPTDRDCRVRLC
jgi:hypothetical protein